MRTRSYAPPQLSSKMQLLPSTSLEGGGSVVNLITVRLLIILLFVKDDEGMEIVVFKN